MNARPDNVIAFPVERTLPPRLLTLAEVAATVGFSERWLRYRVAEGMPCRRWANRLRFDIREVEHWLGERYAA